MTFEVAAKAQLCYRESSDLFAEAETSLLTLLNESFVHRMKTADMLVPGRPMKWPRASFQDCHRRVSRIRDAQGRNW